MKVFIYAIESSKDGRICVGQATNIEIRLKQHNAGQVKSTSFYRPWNLFYNKECADRKDARQLEKYLKSGCGKEFLKELRARSSIG